MSHELRTPLNAILGFTQLMESAAPLPTLTQKRSLDQILKAGWYLLELINEILDLALIESGNVTLSREPVALADYLELEAEDRMGKIPFVIDAGGNRRAVLDTLLRKVEKRVAVWSLLGRYTLSAASPGSVPRGPEPGAEGMPEGIPAPETIPSDQVEEALAALRGDYEERLAELRLDMARRVRGRLLALVSRRSGNGGEKSEA